ncbi:MAG: DNA adenine methylase [Pseudomonadota bacterium]
MKPVLKWAGGKTSLIPQLVKHFPNQFKRYFEPFLGGGAVFLALGDSKYSVINDVNSEITNLYEIIRDQPVDLMSELDGLAKKYSESFYYELRASEPRAKVKKAARTLFLNKTCFNGLYRQNSRGEFNVPFGKRLRIPKLYDRNQFLEVSKKLKKAKLLNLDFEEVIDLAGSGDFIYCDPPYEPVSVTSSFNAYTLGGFTKKDQMRLLEAAERAVSRGAQVAISNSSAPFVKKLFKKWKVVTLVSRRSINSKGDRRGLIEEILAKSY